MKRAAKHFLRIVIVMSCLAFLHAPSAVTAADNVPSLREFLLASKNVAEVYPIDDFLTFVIPEKNLITGAIKGDFDEEFFNYCKEKGAIEGKFAVTDPLTNKETNAWTPLKLEEKNKFIHPQTGQAEKFSPDLLYRGIALKDGVSSPLRVKDYMEITEVVKSERNAPRSLIVRTKDAQPHVYKIKTIPAYNKIVMPPDGDLAKTVSEIKDSRSGSLFKSAPGQKDADIFVYLTALCMKNKLTPKYFINEGEFVPVPDAYLKYFVNNAWQSGYFKVKLKEITSALEMFRFMADLGSERNKFTVWYFQGAGDKKFIAKGSEERTVEEKGNIASRFQIVFVNNRDMEGIFPAPSVKGEAPQQPSAEKSGAEKKETPAKTEAGVPQPSAAPPQAEDKK
jgi:hypothetical protein